MTRPRREKLESHRVLKSGGGNQTPLPEGKAEKKIQTLQQQAADKITRCRVGMRGVQVKATGASSLVSYKKKERKSAVEGQA